VVGNVAALTDHKDHATLLRAAAIVVRDCPAARFVIVGQGELIGRLRDLARSLGIESYVVFTGFRQDIDALLPAFDIFCLSSHMEGLGTSLLDAMVFARPIVATAAGGIPDAVQDGVSGRLAPPRDPEALASALLEVLKDSELRRRLGAAGRLRYEEFFTVERMVSATLDVYGGLA
jgi:glycosyltransferase involved in cell wall biosynthesis